MWDAAGCMLNPRIIKGSQGLHLETSVQSHGKGEEVKDFSFLTYMNLVWKLFVRCRNCCLVVRSFQMAALQALCVCVCLRTCVWGPCVCVPWVLGNIFITITPSCWSLPALRGRKEVGRVRHSWNFLESPCFQQEDPKEAIQEELLGLQEFEDLPLWLLPFNPLQKLYLK